MCKLYVKNKINIVIILNSIIDSNFFWFEVNIVEFEEYICICFKKVS